MAIVAAGELDASAVTSADRGLAETAASVVAAVGALNLASAGLARDWSADWFPAWARVVAASIYIVMLLLLIVVVVDGRLSRALFPLVVSGQLVVTGVLFLAGQAGTPPDGISLTQPGYTVALCLAVLTMRSTATRVIWVVLLSLTYATLRALATNWVISIGEVVITIIGAYTLRAILMLLADAFSAARDLEDAQLATRAEAQRRETARHVRQKWDRLLHDKVLGALLLTSRSTSFTMLATARKLAGEALEALGLVEGPDHERATNLSTVASRWGIRLEGHHELPEGLPDNVRDGVLAAASEILANASRHAGVDVVTSTVTRSADGLKVVLQDDGPGFVMGRFRGRFGLSQSIPGHMAAVGGSAEVTSSPGVGTTATLTWVSGTSLPHHGHRESGIGPGWQVLGMRATIVIPIVWMSAHAAISLHGATGLWVGHTSQPLVLGWPWLVWSLVAGLVASVLLSTNPVRGWVPVVVVSLPVCLGLLVALTPSGPATDWRLWFIGASLPASLGLILQGHRTGGLVQSVLGLVAVVAGLASHGPATLAASADVLHVPVLVSLGAAALMLLIDRANARIRTSTEEIGALQAAERAMADDAALAGQRREDLSRHVIPLLLRIWSGEILTAADRQEAALIEADARDRLTGSLLLNDEVTNAAHEARRRGAKVSLLASPGSGPAMALGSFQHLIRLALADSGAGSVVTASWHADQAAQPTTLHVDSPAATPDPVAYSLAVRDTAFRVELSDDEIWLELVTPPGHPHVSP